MKEAAVLAAGRLAAVAQFGRPSVPGARVHGATLGAARITRIREAAGRGGTGDRDVPTPHLPETLRRPGPTLLKGAG
ncbi:hypothetical protein GCM10010388_60530 [Streptomyces mauvecolor]